MLPYKCLKVIIFRLKRLHTIVRSVLLSRDVVNTAGLASDLDFWALFKVLIAFISLKSGVALRADHSHHLALFLEVSDESCISDPFFSAALKWTTSKLHFVKILL